MKDISITANQLPHRKNYLSRLVRSFASFVPAIGIYPAAHHRPQGISVYMRVKDEKDWIFASIESIKGIADEIVIVDNGSTDGTYEILQALANQEKERIKLWKKAELYHCDLSNYALSQTRFKWLFRWDGDMVARTDGEHNISKLREQILELNTNRYYVIYLRHVNLAGDLFHQDLQEMVHIEEYVHTFFPKARFIHPKRFEAVKFPKYYKPLFWYEPYGFHVDVKPARRMLLRYFWEDWMELKDYKRYPTLEKFVQSRIQSEFGTASVKEAEELCVKKVCKNYISYDHDVFGPYPELLRPYLNNPKYKLIYKDGKIIGRKEL